MIDDFRSAIMAAGMEPPEHIEPGRFHRFPGFGKRNGNTAGWCRLFPDGKGGSFGDHSRDLSETWQTKREQPMTQVEKAAFNHQVEESRRQAEAQRAKENAEAAKKASEVWLAATPAKPDHPYLVAKGVMPHGIRQDGGKLVIPVFDIDGTLHGIQTISSSCEKRFLAGMAKTGHFFKIGTTRDNICLAAEGYATAASLHECTGHAVVVCFDAGNLPYVAKAIHQRHHRIKIIIAGDNDESGTGQQAAKSAAAGVGGLVAIPPDTGDDFNDLHRKCGPEAVKACIEAAIVDDDQRSWFADALRENCVSRFLDNDPPQLDWVFEGSLLTKTTGMLVGPGANGKSTLANQMLMAIATGHDILPGIFTPARPGAALGIFGEDSEVVLHHRFRAMVSQLFPRDQDAQALLRKNLHIVTTSGRDVRFLDQATKNLAASEFFGEVFAAVKGIDNLRLIILDPASRFHGAEENDNGAGTFLVSLLERLAKQTGAAVIVLHHVSKRAGITQAGFDLDQAMHQDAARGASGLTNAVRWQCNLFGIPEKDCKRLVGVSDARPGQYLAIKVSKKNYGLPEETKFLERGSGGVLRPFERATLNIAADLDKLVQGLIFDAVLTHEGQVLTRRRLVDGYCRDWKKDDHRISRAIVEQTISACILRGELFERQGKNGSGKSVSYLSKYPKHSVSLEPEGTGKTILEPEGKPEGFEPEEPEGTGKNELTDCNSSESLEEFKPEGLNRKNDAFRFVSARYCETVNRKNSSPYGGDNPPSGLDRGGNPPMPEEDVNAEYF